MGFLDIFRGMFRQKAEQLEMPFEQLEQWFDEKVKHKYSARDETVKVLYDQFDAKIKELAEMVSALEVAELHNQNIAPKMLAYMVGNRNNYVKQVRLLIDSIPEFGIDFPNKFQKVLDDFTRKTAKSYIILQEFFANETRNIAQVIKVLDMISKQIVGTVMKKDLVDLENIKQHIAKIHEKQAEQDALVTKINSTKDEANAKLKEHNQLKEKIAKRRESKQFAEVMRLKELVAQQKTEMTRMGREINDMFAPLGRAFKKYKRISLDHEKLLEQYLEDPVNALMVDPKLKIMSAVEGILKSIDKLDFDNKEKKKIAEKLSAITKERLQDMLDTYSKFKAIVSQTEDKLDEYRIVEEIAQLEMDLDMLQNAVNRFNGMIEADINKIAELNTGIEHILSDVQSGVASVLNINLRVVFRPKEIEIERTVQF